MDSFFTSLSKRQSMMLLTAVTFGGQESLAALEHLPEEEGALLRHRAQELLQIPRDKRIPALVQEIKKLVKDRRGQLWSAEPERLASLLQRERGALVEVVLRALPGTLADAVRSHLPPTRVKLSREVRPQVLDIVRWKLEEALARETGAQAAAFKFSDVLQLQQRELLTVCDRLGARVLGPAMAGLPDAERDAFFEPLPPDLKLLAGKSVQANAPRKLPEDDARAQLALHEAEKSPAGAIRSAGVQRLARACVAQSPEFAARMLEKYRGEFGSLLAKWVREERLRPTARGDGGRTDIVMDLERLAARGFIERPVRLASAAPPRQSAVLPPPPGARKAAANSMAASRVASAVQPGPGPRGESMRGPAVSRQASAVSADAKRDFMAERAARNAGALSSREPSRVTPGVKAGAPSSQEGSAVRAPPPRASSAGARREPESAQARPVRPDPEGARIGPPPSRLGQRGPARPRPEENAAAQQPRERSRVGAGESSRVRPSSQEPSRVRPPPQVPDEQENSRVFRSLSSSGRSAVRGQGAPEAAERERPPRVVAGRAPTASEGTAVQRRPRGAPGSDRPEPPGAGRRGPRGGTR